MPPAKSISPGEILAKEFMEPQELSANELARRLFVPPNRITSIINGTRAISADTALRLARYFQTTPEFWLNLQSGHELALALKENGKRIEDWIIPGPKKRRRQISHLEGAAS